MAGRKTYYGGQGKSVSRRGSGLGTGPVGRTSGGSGNTSGRKTNYGGQGKSVSRRGSGLGTGPVGRRRTK